MIGWCHAAVVENEGFFSLKNGEKTQTNKKLPQTNKKEEGEKKKKDQTSLAVMAKILVEAADQCSNWECLGFISPKQPQIWLQGHGGDPRAVAEKGVPALLRFCTSISLPGKSQCV